MPWNKSLTDLQDHLCSLFPLQDDILPLAEKAGLNIGQIAIADKGWVLWYNVLKEARQRGLLDELILEARRLYPDDEILASSNANLIDADKEMKLDTVKELCTDIIREGQLADAIPLLEELIARSTSGTELQEGIITRFAEVYRHKSMVDQGKKKSKAQRFLSLSESDLIALIQAL